MTAILGISAFYHDSAAALLVDGEIVAAAQEERFTRKKHDEDFPKQSVSYCLEQSKLDIADIDYVVFYEKPLLKFERLIETFVRFAPLGYASFRQAIPNWINSKLRIPKLIRQGLDGRYKGPLVFTEHHESHAASAFFPSPFDASAILTIDGVGEWSTTCIGYGSGNKIEIRKEIRFPHSLGLLYSAFTYYTGFRVNSGEYKLMGLAPYGKPTYRQQILDHLIDLKEDGSFRLDMKYFNYCQGLTMTSKYFNRLFGGTPRSPESKLTQRDMDIAASIQSVTEEAMLKLAIHAHKETGSSNLVLAGGVALNCVGNGKILREGPFEHIWIQPASGDAGGALGAATFTWHQLLNQPRKAETVDSQKGSLLGPAHDDACIRSAIDSAGLSFSKIGSEQELCDHVAELIDNGSVIGWFQGRMEFGPRALGARSILGDARSNRMQQLMNLKIKFRESFRPFAPIVLEEYADHYFELDAGQTSPYMLLVAPVRSELCCEPDEHSKNESFLERLQHVRSTIPAVTHIDFSARIQTVSSARNPMLHRLMKSFHHRTGCGVMINTSFNVRSEPIVCTPSDAVRCFVNTDIDVLVMGHFVVDKNRQAKPLISSDREAHLKQFQLD